MPQRLAVTMLLALLLPLTQASAQAPAPPPTQWTLDKIHSRIGFGVSHFRITQVNGYFREFEGHVTSPSEDFLGGTAEFTAKTASVFTDNEDRDGHLKSDDFFNAKQFPELKFKGTFLKENGKPVLKGQLTIRDVTRPVTLDVTYGGRIKDSTFKIEKAGFKISGKIHRLDFGLKWNETFEGGGAIVGNEVELLVNAEIDKQPPAVAPGH